MRKNFFLPNALCALMLAGTMMVSCSDDDKSEEKVTDEIIEQIPAIDGDKQLTVEEQKNYLDQVGKAFLTEFQSNNFDNLIDLINYAYETYGDNYDWDNVESWAKDAFDALVRNESGNQLVADFILPAYGEEKIHCIEYENVTEIIYTASAFTGHFVAENGKWTSSPADNLQFSFSDQNGKPCVLTVATSGKTVDAYFGKSTDIDRKYTEIKDNEKYNYEVVRNSEITKNIVSVPEHITITLSQDGKELLKSEINTDLSIASATEYDFSKDQFATTTTTQIENYTFEVSKASFSNKDKKAEAYFKLKKGDVKLLEYSIKANVEVEKNTNIEDEDDEEYNLKAFTSEYTIDILGKVQIKGTSTDAKKLDDILEEAKEYEVNNSEIYKEKIAAANEYIDLGLYFDGGKTKQLSLMLEPFEHEVWKGDSFWKYEYTFLFADGSKNAVEDYLVRANFTNIFDLYDDMEDDYNNKIKID